MAFPLSAPPSLVIFDCDGVLVDTETIANRLLVKLLAEDGLTISYEESRSLFLGKTLEAVMAHAEGALGRPLRADWVDYVRDETLKAFAQGVEAIPHVRDVLLALKARKIPYCVASSGKFEKMRFAAKSMGFAPASCVVIEDSLPGVQAAVTAGMPVLGYAGDPHTDAEGLKAEGAQVFSDMRKLLGLLGFN